MPMEAKISSVVLFNGGYLELALAFEALVGNEEDDELERGADEKEPLELNDPLEPLDLLVPKTGGCKGDTDCGRGGAEVSTGALMIGEVGAL
mmetsp:Transcript_20934/g.35303  ORF Transcript_20934/g.35303 Transcript_20934/m.35303 type:complete len:92 (+) Transcript_20934:397-672(+)